MAAKRVRVNFRFIAGEGSEIENLGITIPLLSEVTGRQCLPENIFHYVYKRDRKSVV